MNGLELLFKSLGFTGKKLDVMLKAIGQTVQLKILTDVAKTLTNEEHEKLAKVMEPDKVKERLEFLQSKIKEKNLANQIQEELKDYFSGLVEVFTQKATPEEKGKFIRLLAQEASTKS